jgi:HEAT repeat protein
MYRGQDIGDREALIQTCLAILSRGKEEQLYAILPHISIIRSPAFFEPLLKLLESGKRNQQEFAAVALGSMGDGRAIKPLFKAFMQSSSLRGSDAQSLQASIIHALGEMGDEGAIEPLQEIYSLDSGSNQASSRQLSWVLSAMGNLAQQGDMLAVKELIRLMRDKDALLRAQAVAELAVAFWHRPNEMPETVLHEIISLTKDPSEEVQTAALDSLSDLAKLGCQGAEPYL